MTYKVRMLCPALFVLLAAIGFAGISRPIQDQYRREYENKAMFLKIPIYTARQMVFISGHSFRFEPGVGAPRHKVGDQLRVLQMDFGGDEIKLRMGEIASPGFIEIIFKFDRPLEEGFSNRDVFDRALQGVLTEGLKYTDIEGAKRGFVQEQFDRAVAEIAGAAAISREATLRSIAPQIPAYQDAQRDIENLKARLQDLSAQLAQSNSEHRKLETETKAQQSELSRLRSANAALQDKIESSVSQVSRLGEELKDAKGSAQGYQRELASIQRSLNIRVDSSRDLSAQIADLGQAMRRLQKDNESLAGQNGSLKTSLETSQASNARLVTVNDELKASAARMESVISTLTSNEDSLARKYLVLRNEKDRLDDFSQAVQALRTRIVEERSDGAMSSGKANVFVREAPIGVLEWRIPLQLGRNESKNAEASFSMESINYVKVTPEERRILRTLGDRLKIRLQLESGAETMKVSAEQEQTVGVIGERDRFSWRWSIRNEGVQDARLSLSARLINRNSQEIPFFKQEHSAAASNLVRRIRNSLQPIPMVVGLVLGFLLFAIFRIFRHAHPHAHPKNPPDSQAPVRKGL